MVRLVLNKIIITGKRIYGSYSWMDDFKKISAQTLWQVLGKLSTSIASIFIIGLVARRYGEEGTGVFTLALTYLGFFYLAADFGLNTYVMPKLMGKDFLANWVKLFGLRLGLSTILVLICLAALPFLPFSDSELFRVSVWFGSLAIVASGVISSANAFFQSRLLYSFSSLAVFVNSVVTSILALFSVLVISYLPSLFLVHMLGLMAGAVVSLLLVRLKTKSIRVVIDFRFIKQTLIGAWPISLTLLLNVVYFRIDGFILGAYRSFSEVGLYNLAFQIFQSALVFPTFIMNALYPILLKSYKKDMSFFKNQVKLAFLMLLGISILGVIATVVFGGWVVQILGGGGFEGSKEALNILAISFPAFFLSSLLMWLLIIFHKNKLMLIIYLMGLGINFGLNLYLIPRYSYIGAAWVTVICEYLILLAQLFMIYPRFQRLEKY